MSGLDKVLISDMMESFVREAPPTPFVSYCEVCHVFLTKEEMVYEKGRVFHKDCFEEHGKEFPDVNYDLISQNINAKVQLIQLKNLKVRRLGSLDQINSITKPKKKTKRKSKKKRTRKRVAKRKTSSGKRKKIKNRSKKKRPTTKRRTIQKRRKKPRFARKPRNRIRRKTASKRKSKKRR